MYLAIDSFFENSPKHVLNNTEEMNYCYLTTQVYINLKVKQIDIVSQIIVGFLIFNFNCL